MLTDTEHAPLPLERCISRMQQKGVNTLYHVPTACTHTYTSHQPSVDAEQFEYFGFYVKPVDSLSMALCKRCNNSLSVHT